jgi:hypothetical protein
MVVKNRARSDDTGSGNAWFEPKRYGYGSGLPIAWQGWAIILGYFVGIALSAWLVLPHSVFAFVAIVLGATAALILICALKTRGGWKWRWGEDS